MTIGSEAGQKHNDQKQNHDRAHQTAGTGEGIERIHRFQQFTGLDGLRVHNGIFHKERCSQP